MIKYTRDEQERLHLQEALRVMLNILSNLNDVMHSTQIIGYPVNSWRTLNKLEIDFSSHHSQDHLNTLGRIRLRSENCQISKEKRRGTVYTRTKTSTRDIFLFERDLVLCKKKEESNGKSVQYQFKEMIKVRFH